MKRNVSRLQRTPQPMPDFVREMLVEENLMQAYGDRPPYQQNDYLGWINRAKRADTQARRVAQMLDELRDGNVYMKMKWAPGR